MNVIDFAKDYPTIRGTNTGNGYNDKIIEYYSVVEPCQSELTRLYVNRYSLPVIERRDSVMEAILSFISSLFDIISSFLPFYVKEGKMKIVRRK